MSHAKVQTDLTAKDAGLSAALSRGESSIVKFGAKIGSVLAVAGTAFVALGAAAMGAAGYLSNLYSTQQREEIKLAAVLKATGNAAGYSSGQLQQMARDFQKVSEDGDEVILSTMSVLATFREIKGEQFKGAIQSTLDMKAVLGTDLKGAAIQLGKALNDPVKGITALSRAGVSFTQEQKDMIKTLQESGDIVGAQQIILAELKGEFGGVAEAMAGTFSGQLAQMKNRLSDLGEQIGQAVLPMFEGMIGKVGKLATWFESAMPSIQGFIGVVTELGDIVGGYLLQGFKAYIDFLAGFFIGEFTAVQVAIQNFGDVCQYVGSAVAFAFVKSFNVLTYQLTEVIPGVLTWFADNWVSVFTDISSMFGTILTNMFSNAKSFFTSLWSWIKGDGFDFKWTGLTEGFEATLTELPEIAERKVGDMEKALGDQMAEAGGRLAGKFNEKYETRMAAYRDFWELPEGNKGPGVDMTPDQAALKNRNGGGDPNNPEFDMPHGEGFGPKNSGTSKTTERKSTFEDLGALYSRIASSAAGGSPEAKTAKASEKTADHTKETAKKSGEMVTAIKQVEKAILKQSGGNFSVGSVTVYAE